MRRNPKDGQITLTPEPFGDAQAYAARAEFMPLVMLTDKAELPPRVTREEFVDVLFHVEDSPAVHEISALIRLRIAA